HGDFGTPRLAPWAVFFRRFAAVVCSRAASEVKVPTYENRVGWACVGLFRPFGASFMVISEPHGLRRGLHSFAASRLRLWCFRNPTACTVGCILSPLCGFGVAFIAEVMRSYGTSKSP